MCNQLYRILSMNRDKVGKIVSLLLRSFMLLNSLQESSFILYKRVQSLIYLISRDRK